MNPFAYRTTSLAIKTLSSILKARVRIHGEGNIPDGCIIFVINHFTRIETLLVPYHIYRMINIPVWSLASFHLFKGPLGSFLDKIGAVSTNDPDRDRLIVRSLLTGEAAWIIFPEGRMVKSKKIVEKGRFMICYAGGKRPPHTGAAALAFRTEFYRQRLQMMSKQAPEETKRLLELFQIESVASIMGKSTYIVPVNITYYPIRAEENILSSLTLTLSEKVPERMIEEMMTEGTMLLSGVDVDMRFGEPIKIENYMNKSAVRRNIIRQQPINFDDVLPSRRVMRKVTLDIMKRYMSAIYSMTTINHDHLLASILRLTPFKRMDVHNLKRRAFLAATRYLEKTGVYVHRSLKEDQVHLLTDDRYNKCNDFIAIAREKGVVTQNKETLIKDPSKFFSSCDLHRVRIENPVAVIANEVEPLTLLQRQLRHLAWQPGFWLRRRIARLLQKRALLEFEKDYQTFYVEAESKPRDVGQPFLIKGRSKKVGVLLIHGYMAAPLEVKELACYLARRGLWVYVPRLKGHGTSPNDLALRTYNDWVRSVDEGYAVISNICRRVIVGGFSTGAGLALEIAGRVQDLHGIFAVSPPMRLQDFSSRLVGAVDSWNRLMSTVRLGKVAKRFIRNNPENTHINYFRNPISGVRELERLMEAVAPQLSTIQIPALVVQAYGDPVVNHKGSRHVFERLGSKDKEYILFNFNRHGILNGDGAHKVHKVIGDFVDFL